MSNKIHFEPTKFESVRTGRITYGCRVYDEGNATYTNTWDSIPDDDFFVIAECIDDFAYTGPLNTSAFGSMLDLIESEQSGVFVGDKWYEWDEIKHLFSTEKK